MPVPLSQLDDVRVTVCRGQDGVKHFCDALKDVAEVSNKPWVGRAVFQIKGDTGRELGMHAFSVSTAKHVGKQQKVHTKRKFKKDQNKNDLSERDMSLEDKLLFRKDKMDELRSFFTNGVWSCQTTREADPQRALTSRMLLKWFRNLDGSPMQMQGKSPPCGAWLHRCRCTCWPAQYGFTSFNETWPRMSFEHFSMSWLVWMES